MPIQAEAEDMLLASFDRLMREQHPVAYARSGPTLDEPGHYAKWALLDDGGWLELADCETEPEAYYPLALGEMMGRSLLSLPLAFSAYVLHPLCQQVPELLGAGTVLPWRQHPGVGRVDPAGPDGASRHFIDFHGRRACYYRLGRADDRDDAWHIRRYDGAEVEVVTGLDVCGALASLPAGSPAAQAGFHLPLGSMQALLRRYLAVELAQTLGAAAAALDMAVAYATERRQFGKPIGQYQAIKHPLANAWVALDNGRYAIRALLDDGAVPGVAGIAARLVVAAATQATRLTIQVHGGIGFAWEHDAHLFLKRVYHRRTQVQRLASVL